MKRNSNNCYNKKNNILNSIILLMEDIWKLSQDLNIYDYYHIYKEANRTINCLTQKGIYNIVDNLEVNFLQEYYKVWFRRLL